MCGKYWIFAVCLIVFIIFFLYILPRIHPIRLAAKMHLRPVIFCSTYVLKSFGSLSTSLKLDHLAAVMADLLYDVGNNAVQQGWYFETNLAAEAIRIIGVKGAERSMNEATREAVASLWELSLRANEFASGQVTSNVLFSLISLTADLSVTCPHLMDFAVQKMQHLETVVGTVTFNDGLRQASLWARDLRPQLVPILRHFEETHR